MRRTRRDLIRVGLFVVAAGTVLVGGLLWIAGSRFLRPVDRYVVLFRQSVSGLAPGANVEYQGVVVGRVRDIRLTGDVPPNVAVDIDVEPGTPVRTDTEAELLGSIVTGIKFIELRGGTAAAPPLRAGGTIPGGVASLEQFRDRLAEIADHAVVILRRLDKEVLTPANTRKFGTLVSDLSSAAHTIDATLESLRAEETGTNLGKLVHRLSAVSERLDTVLAQLQHNGGDVYGQLESVLRHADEVAVALRDLVRVTDQQIGGERASLGALIAELTATAQRLQETLDVIRSNPSMLLWGRPVPERELRR
jgi:phospholipid/cholesterol/gamma-HCH transport system substrate-binding protein